MIEPSFQTERLDVFLLHVHVNWSLGEEKHVYLAFHREEEIPYPLVTLTVGGDWVEWIETHQQHRREGYASELVKALDVRGIKLEMTGATPEGDAFVDAVCTEG